MKKITQKEFAYHGEKIEAPYFEGWYYKINTETMALAVIVGITKNTKDDHGLIQTMDTISKKAQYIRFFRDRVSIEDNPFHIQIEDNHFYHNKIVLNLTQEIIINGTLLLSELTPLKETKYAPTIMGPFHYFPKMECTHMVYSLYHKVQGQLMINGHDIDLSNATGYIEKDRGTSFPKKYFWLQSNRAIEKNKVCVFLSIAEIPIWGIHFTGIICTLLVDNEQLRIGTYYGAVVKVLKKIDDKKYKIIIVQNSYTICFKVEQGEVCKLAAPNFGDMQTKVFESLDSKVTVHVYKDGRLLHDLHFSEVGCEVHGY